MFRIKLANYNVITTLKPPKTNNVQVNVVVVITICSQQPEHHVFKEKESIKAKELMIGNKIASMRFIY
jgi:hypothetical protein